MATVSSNMDEVENLLNEMVDGFNFNSPGVDGRGLANEVLDIATEGIVERTLADQQTFDGKRLEPNAEDYLKRKGKAGKPVGVLTGEMVSMVQMKGQREIAEDEATQEYGVDEFPKRKAQWFTHGSAENRADSDGIEPSGAINQPQRPFYKLDEAIEARMHEHVEKALEVYIADLG